MHNTLGYKILDTALVKGHSTTNPAAKRNVPKVVKPVWAALRVRDAAISQRSGNEHERIGLIIIGLIIKRDNIEARAALDRRLIEDRHLNGV
jgi:hypothetical protein